MFSFTAFSGLSETKAAQARCKMIFRKKKFFIHSSSTSFVFIRLLHTRPRTIHEENFVNVCLETLFQRVAEGERAAEWKCVSLHSQRTHACCLRG